MPEPLPYFLTFTCYGTWLHGDERGSVDREHHSPAMPVLAPDSVRLVGEQDRQEDPPYVMDRPRRLVMLRAILEISGRKRWSLHAVHIRPTHVHVVVTAPGEPERVLNDI